MRRHNLCRRRRYDLEEGFSNNYRPLWCAILATGGAKALAAQATVAPSALVTFNAIESFISPDHGRLYGDATWGM
jgi:hypothetical protein